MPAHALICGIGGQSASDLFFLGSSFSVQSAPKSGSLFCGMNDNNYADNQGSWTATVTVGEEPFSAVPVILVHGYCGYGPKTFGEMKALLESDLEQPVFYFNYNNMSDPIENNVPDPNDRASLIRLARRLGEFIKQTINGLNEEQGSSITQVDVVAHSLGGLITRAWMADLTLEPYDGEIRRLVLAGTPNFGVSAKTAPPVLSEVCHEFKRIVGFGIEHSSVTNRQRDQMIYGSQFLQLLNEFWEDELENAKIHPQDIMTVAGCTVSSVPEGACSTDGLVEAASASLLRRSPDYAVRYVKKKHFKSLLSPGAGMVDIDSAEHDTYELVRAFSQ